MKILNIDKSAAKEIERLDTPTRKRIIAGISGLIEEPPQGNIKSLKGQLKGLNRLRIGNWRIIYQETEKTIDVLSISSRGDAYK